MNENLIIIPARAGSKGIPIKNMALIDGIPLLEFTIKSALASKIKGHICLSTDSSEMQEFGRSCQIEAPFLRPSEFAQDNSSSLSVIKHCLDWYQKNIDFSPENIILLQPTCPFRRPESIKYALKLIKEKKADSLISVNKVINHPCEYITETENGFSYVMKPPEKPGRQNFPEVYFINGAIYICRTDFFERTGQLYDENAALYKISNFESVDIDEPEDLENAICIYKNNKEKINWIKR